MLNVKTAKTSDLVAFYNENSGNSPIKKFVNRATAERRVAEILAEIAPKAAAKAPKSRSEGIAKSWQDPAVAAKRAERHVCVVDGFEYSSVAAAYRALGLPMNDHIQIRMMLKEAGRLEFDGQVWEVFPKG